MSKPLISIVVPVYKVEKYLDECVRSIVSQTYTNIEIILVNDGSPDGCPVLCDEWAKRDSRIKVVHKQNGGLVSARKAGLLASSGEYIMNVDSDDYIGSELVQSVADAISANGSPDIVAFNCHHVFPDKSILLKNTLPDGLYEGESLRTVKESLLYDRSRPGINYGGMLFSIWSKAFRRDILLDTQLAVPNEVKMGEDVAVSVPSILKCNSICLCPFADYYYRANPTSIVHTFDEQEFEKQKKLLNYVHQHLTGVYENQFNLYVLFILLNYLTKTARHCSFKKFKRISNTCLSSEIKQALKDAKIFKPTFKNRVFLFLLRHRFFLLMYIPLKRLK